jgi:aminoglycoside phosphotransferase (APT) family kinase protein
MGQSKHRRDEAGATSDPGIPTLQAVLGLATMEEHLRRVLSERWGPVAELRIQILKRHRTRCTFEADWADGNVRRSVIGKVYEADRADVYRTMEAIRRAGFGPDDTFSIPEPLAYVPELRLLVLEKVSGPRVKEILLTGADADAVDASERCANWLARFHAVAPRLGESYLVDDALSALEPWTLSFGAAGDVLVDKAKRLREQLEAAAGRLEPAEPCASHGHYSCGQIVVDERHTVAVDAPMALGLTGFEVLARDRTVAFDWDGYNVADPCRDVARFVVDLKRLAWKTPASGRALDRAAAVFLKNYLSRSRGTTGSNLPFYAATLCFRLASKDIDLDSPEKAEAMLDEGLRVLEHGLSSWMEDS